MARRQTGRVLGRRRTRWILLTAAGATVLVGAGLLGWHLLHPSSTGVATTRTVQVAAQTVQDTVGATGTVEPRHRADLSFASSGTVTAVKVAVGDKVRKGDKLATLDDDELQADLDAAQAGYSAAVDDDTAAEDDDDSTDAELAAARSKVAVAASAVSQARSALKAATLRSTVSGTVALVTIAEGDTVGSSSGGAGSGSGAGGSGSSSGSGSTSAAVTVISTDSYTVTTSVGSADLARVKKGLQAQILLSGATQPVYGTVASVAVIAAGTSGTTSGPASFPVTIDVTGQPKGLFAGATATVSIIIRQRDNVLTVPTAAISTVNGQTSVDKLVGGVSVPTTISVGESFGASTEVTKGLLAGDQVVVTNANRVASGSRSAGGRSTSPLQGGGFSGTGQNGGQGTGQGAGQAGGTR